MGDLPIACELPASEIAHRRHSLLPGLVEHATSRESLPDGFRWRFDPEASLLSRIADVIDAERSCCRFLRFRVDVGPGRSPVSLEVTGPEGTVAFLSQLAQV